jgi:hypothetical protein
LAGGPRRQGAARVAETPTEKEKVTESMQQNDAKEFFSTTRINYLQQTHATSFFSQ